MRKKDIITKLVYDTIDEINEELPKNQQIGKSSSSIIYGSKGYLDSIGLVNFVVAAEQKIEDELGITINLTDEKAMSQKNSPFKI